MGKLEDLPLDMLYKILECVPVGTIIDSMFLSKSWLKIISPLLRPRDFDFGHGIHRHKDKSDQNIGFVNLFKRCNTCFIEHVPYNYLLLNLRDSSCIPNQKTWVPLINSEIMDVSLGSCDGMLLVAETCKTKLMKRIRVMNPLLNEVLTLPTYAPPYELDWYNHSTMLMGMGYVTLSKQYKIISVFKYRNAFSYHVYLLGNATHSWNERKDISPTMFTNTDPNPVYGVKAGEAVYWLVENIVPNIREPERRIVAFNLREESFTLVTYPPIGEGRHHLVCRDKITSFKDDTLCLCHWVQGDLTGRSKVEIWILKSDKWTQPHSLSIPEFGVPLTAPRTSQMFIWMQSYFICRSHPNGITLVRTPDKSLHMPVRHADSLVSLKALGEKTSKHLTETNKLCYREKTKPSASQDTQYDSLVMNFLRKCTSQQAPARYSNQDLEYAAKNLHFLYQTLSKCETVVSQYLELHPEASAARRATVQEKFQDLDTPELLSAALHWKLSLITKDLDKISKGQYPEWKLRHLADMQKEMENLLRSQGLLPFSDYSEVLKQLEFFGKSKVG